MLLSLSVVNNCFKGHLNGFYTIFVLFSRKKLNAALYEGDYSNQETKWSPQTIDRQPMGSSPILAPLINSFLIFLVSQIFVSLAK